MNVAPGGNRAIVSGTFPDLGRDGTIRISERSPSTILVIDLDSNRVRERFQPEARSGPIIWASQEDFIAAVGRTLKLYSPQGRVRALADGIRDVAFSKRRDAALIRDASGQFQVIRFGQGESATRYPRPAFLDNEILLLPDARVG